LRRPYIAVPPVGVLVALLAIVATTAMAPDSLPLPLAGFADEIGHLATGLLVLAILRCPRRGLAWGLLAASVLIDVDHIPHVLGGDWLTRGTPRPYPHSLLTPLSFLGVAAFAGRRQPAVREVALGITLGLVAHFVRDFGEGGGGVPLLWPWTDAGSVIPRWSYLVLMFALAGLGVARGLGEPGSLTSLEGLVGPGRGRPAPSAPPPDERTPDADHGDEPRHQDSRDAGEDRQVAPVAPA